MSGPNPAGRAIRTSTPDKVAGEVKRKRRNRKRTQRATLQRKIHARAVERQEAWSETGLADLTDTLTRKLNRDFSDLRKTDPPEGDEFRGRTAKAGR